MAIFHSYVSLPEGNMLGLIITDVSYCWDLSLLDLYRKYHKIKSKFIRDYENQ
jgi:hypothetical protein